MTVGSDLLNESIAFHQAGQLATAVQGYAALLKHDPENADAWHLSGVAALQTGRLDDAIRNIRRAIELRSDVLEFHANLAAVYLQKGELKKAETFAAEAVRLGPDSGVAHFRLAKVLAGLGHVDDALHHLQRAWELGFDPAATLLEASVVYRSVGDMGQSANALQRSAQLADDPIPALCQLAQLASQGYYELTPGEFETLISAVRQGADQEVQARRAARAAFAVATVLEYAGHYRQAFELYDAGNQLTRKYLSRSKSANWLAHRHAYAERLRQHCRAEQIRGAADQGHASRRPIFVVGFPRSGTSLVAQILASHSQVASAGELKSLSRLASQAMRFDDASRPGSAIPSDQLRQWGSSYLDELDAYDAQASHVVDKMPGNSLLLGMIHVIFPSATLIWCRRDPRDVAMSCFSIMFEDDQLQFETSRLDWLVQMLNLNSAMRDYWHSVLPGKIHEVQYEQLTSHPEQEIRRLLHACSLPWEPACLAPESQPSVVRTASSLQVRKPIHRQSQRRWERFQPWVDQAFEQLDELRPSSSPCPPARP